jgi:hypothetical protein
MNNRFIDIVSAALNVFGFRGSGFRIGKGFALVLDPKHTINIVPGPGSDRARIFCFVGSTSHVPPEIAAIETAGQNTTGPASEQWRSHHEDIDGVTWSISHEATSGLLLLSSDALLDALDPPTLGAWLEDFFQRVCGLGDRLSGGWEAGAPSLRKDKRSHESASTGQFTLQNTSPEESRHARQ